MIEDLRFQGKRVELVIDGETVILHESVYFETSPSVGDDFDWQDSAYRSQVQFAFDLGANYVLSRQKTSRQVIDYLINKDYQVEVAEDAVARLRELHLIDDEAYAQAYIESFHGERGQRYLEQKLWERGIRSVNLPEEDPEIVCRILEKKWGISGISEAKERLKAQNFLVSRGFSYDTIRKALQLYENLESKR